MAPAPGLSTLWSLTSQSHLPLPPLHPVSFFLSSTPPSNVSLFSVSYHGPPASSVALFFPLQSILYMAAKGSH